MYTPTHVHTHFSLLDGLSQMDQIAKRLKELNIPACTMTDHGGISGAVQFIKALKEEHIKPILGSELYISEQGSDVKNADNASLSHQVVLAKNLEGWKQLVQITSDCNHPDHFYYKPRISLEGLRKYCGNLIGLSGHHGSVLANAIIDNGGLKPDWKKVGQEKIKLLQDLFGKDNFYIEIQLFNRENDNSQVVLAEALRELSILTGCPRFATIDAHYCSKDDAILQRVLLCQSLNQTFPLIKQSLEKGESVPLGGFFKSDMFYILSPDEMYKYHVEFDSKVLTKEQREEELINTVKLAERIEEYNILSPPILPAFKCPNNMIDEEYLRVLCREGWKEKLINVVKGKPELSKLYADRVNEELAVLQGANLSSYFLIVRDILDYCKKNGWLVGPGRGSAAGCLVSYLIGITQVDPIKYGLLFSRFYNAARKGSMPDIDIDIPKYARDKVVQYLREKYGHDRVAHMITYQTLKGRQAIKAVFRAHGKMSFEEMNRITKQIPDPAKIAGELQEMKEEYGESSIIQWTLENKGDTLKDWVELDKDNNIVGPYAEEFKQAIRLEKTKITQSKHASGIIIGPDSLNKLCPMIYDSQENELVAGMEMEDLEGLGLIKLDLLGLAMLDKIMGIQNILAGKDLV